MINNSRRDFLRKTLATLAASSVLIPENCSAYSVHPNKIPESPQKPVEWENWTQKVYDSKKPRIAFLTRRKEDKKIYEVIQDESGSACVGISIDSKYLNPQI
jgi:hypothetical protein